MWRKLCIGCLTAWAVFGTGFAIYTLRIGAEAPKRAYIYAVSSKGAAFTVGTATAEEFGKHSNYPIPRISSMDTALAFKQFCAGSEAKHPDIASVERRITKQELDYCTERGVVSITETLIGHDRSAPLYLYIKHTHYGVVPGLNSYLREIVAAHASGENGYLARLGVTPLAAPAHAEMAKNVRALTRFTRDMLEPPR